MDWLKILAIAGAGLVAGYINTLAGSGSLITLPVLIFMGLPANLANGTNRISVLLQSLVATLGFKKQKKLDSDAGAKMTIPVLAGSIAGALLAVDMNEDMMEKAIGFLLMVMFFLILFRPEMWLKKNSGEVVIKSRIMNFIAFFIAGFYGGFIQAGVGFFLLAALVLGYGTDLVKANALKAMLTFALSVVALIIFIVNRQVDYKLGLILAAGSMVGAWLGTKSAVSWGPVFLRYVLLIAILGSALKFIFF
jgi:uncharacterized membrane protein YfcA